MRRAYLTMAFVLVVSTAAAQHGHPPEDAALHEKFYSTWYMPDNPVRSCCNSADCYPTESSMSAAASTHGAGRTGSIF
jgi:hypothetical protein